MTGLLAEFQAEADAVSKRCLFGKALDAMPADDAADVEKALQSQIPSSHIARVLNRHQFRMGEGVVRNHRNSSCCCGEASDGQPAG